MGFVYLCKKKKKKTSFIFLLSSLSRALAGFPPLALSSCHFEDKQMRLSSSLSTTMQSSAVQKTPQQQQPLQQHRRRLSHAVDRVQRSRMTLDASSSFAPRRLVAAASSAHLPPRRVKSINSLPLLSKSSVALLPSRRKTAAAAPPHALPAIAAAASTSSTTSTLSSFLAAFVAGADSWRVWSGLLAAAAFGSWAEKNTAWGKELSGPLVSTLGGLALASCCLIPAGAAPEYSAVNSRLLPLAVPLLLFTADLRRTVADAGRLLVPFFIGAAATAAATVLAFAVVPLTALEGMTSVSGSSSAAASSSSPPLLVGWRVAAALAARHIGGAVNYVGAGLGRRGGARGGQPRLRRVLRGRLPARAGGRTGARGRRRLRRLRRQILLRRRRHFELALVFVFVFVFFFVFVFSLRC